MRNAKRRAIAAVAYRLRCVVASRVRALPASCASRGPDASKGLRLQQRVVNAAMEHVRKSLQRWLAVRCQLCLSWVLHLELAACKTLGISFGPRVSLQPLEARLQAGVTPCQKNQSWPPLEDAPRGLVSNRARVHHTCTARPHKGRSAAHRSPRGRRARRRRRGAPLGPKHKQAT